MQVKFAAKKLTDFGHGWADILNRDNADGHSQTGNRKKNRQVKFERQAEEQKHQDFVYTPSRIKHLFTQAAFYFGS